MMHNSVGQISEKTGEDRSRMLKLRIDGGSGGHQLRHDMPVHEWQKAFTLDSEDGPWVSCEVSQDTNVLSSLRKRGS